MDFKPDYKVLDHTADLGIEVRGKELKDLFANAALALTKLMLKVSKHGIANSRNLSITGEDLPDLMVRWLGEILYIFEVNGEILTGLKIGLVSDSRLEAKLDTRQYDPQMDELIYEIKAVTYHQISVLEKEDHWEARVIFDL